MSAQPFPPKYCSKCLRPIVVSWPPTEHKCEPPMKDENLWPCPKDTATIAAEIESDAYHAKAGREFTYTGHQPQNVDAWRIGEACRKAADDPKCGDYIDRGLILLKELEAKGYGVFIIDAAIVKGEGK